jgi:hypothetical protein
VPWAPCPRPRPRPRRGLAQPCGDALQLLGRKLIREPKPARHLGRRTLRRCDAPPPRRSRVPEVAALGRPATRPLRLLARRCPPRAAYRLCLAARALDGVVPRVVLLQRGPLRLSLLCLLPLVRERVSSAPRATPSSTLHGVSLLAHRHLLTDNSPAAPPPAAQQLASPLPPAAPPAAPPRAPVAPRPPPAASAPPPPRERPPPPVCVRSPPPAARRTPAARARLGTRGCRSSAHGGCSLATRGCSLRYVGLPLGRASSLTSEEAALGFAVARSA